MHNHCSPWRRSNWPKYNFTVFTTFPAHETIILAWLNPVPQCDCSYSELSAGERLLRWLNRRIEAKISMWDSQSSCNLCEKRCALVEVGQCEVQVSDCRGRRADNGGAERGFRGNNSDKVRSQQRINKDLLPSWLQILKDNERFLFYSWALIMRLNRTTTGQHMDVCAWNTGKKACRHTLIDTHTAQNINLVL